MSTKLKLGFAGLGNMGQHMAAHLATYGAANGASVTVWNRTQAKCEALKKTITPATFVPTLEELAASADVIFVMVLNDAASADVVAKIGAVGSGKIIVDHSSVSPKSSIEHEKLAVSHGNCYLTAPVFGRPDAAQAGTLIQLVSGDDKAKATVRPILETWSKAVIDIGAEVYKASTLKLMGNALILGVIELLGETFALGDAVGIDSAAFLQFIDLFFPTPSYMAYGRKIAEGSFGSAGGFRLEGGLKDARNMLAAGADLGHPVNLPTIQLAQSNMQRAVELGGSDMDWSSLAAILRQDAGLPPFKKEQK